MKNVTLISLDISNFKGIDALRLDFNGKSCNIYGANGSGKSTVEDAWHWLLFGKNKRGAADFSIKPLDLNGDIRDHGAYTSVTAVINIDGETTELRRTYFEKWSQKRGNENKTFDGNASEFYIDGVPRKKNEFDAAVKSQIVPEDVFMLITRLTAFSEALNWQKRRQVLFDLLDTRSDGELMALDERFKPLSDMLGKLCIDDFKRKLTSSRKQYSEEKNVLPKRIDEVTTIVRGLREEDYETLRSRLASVSEKKDALSAELVKLDNNSAVAEKRNELAYVRNELAALENRNREYRANQAKPVETSVDELYSMKCREAERTYRDLLAKQSQTECDISELTEKQHNTRAEYKSVFVSTIPAEQIACPACGRDYDETALGAARQKFDTDKKNKLASLLADGTAVKSRADELSAALLELNTKVSEAAAELERVKTAKPVHTSDPVIIDISEYGTEKARLKASEAALLEQLSAISADSDSVRVGLLRQINDLRQAITDINGKLGGEAILATTEKRINELNARAREISDELEKMDRLLYLCDEFTKFKVSFIEESVNSLFNLARFKLFDTQVNGALVDCCVATYLGVPYDDVNTSAQMNLGLDIISVVSEHCGVRVPLFCDNSESVSEYIPGNTQTIRLYVSENDKELRIEVNELDSKEKGVNTNSAA